MTPFDVLQEAISYGILFNRRRDPMPGAVIRRLPAEARGVLQDLKSADIAKIRVGLEEASDAFFEELERSGLLQAFDRKIL